MSKKILYIGTLINSDVQQQYDLSYHSRAANNKKRGIISSLQECNADVTVVSPIFVNNNSWKYHGSKNIVDDDLGVLCYIPITIDIYGLNYLLLPVTTTVIMLRLLFDREFDVIIFYDFQLETTIPGIIGSMLFSIPLILEYEDGLFFHDNVVIRWTSKILRLTTGTFVDGSLCVNQPLAELVPTNNTVIVRGFPSIGMPDELPNQPYKQDKTVVMFAGRFDEVRGINNFLHIAPRVDRDEVIFWVSGYGPEHELSRVENHVESIDDDRFVYFGTLPWKEYRKRIVSADILVNFQDPYHEISRFTFPSKLLDFMSAGAAVVSTEMSDLKQKFDDKIIIAGKSNAALRNGLERTIVRYEQKEVQKRRENARQWVQTECSPERVGSKILKLIKQAE